MARRLTNLEKLVLSAAFERCTADRRALLIGQMGKVNRVSRMFGGQNVYFYEKHWGRVRRDARFLLDLLGENTLARLQFRVNEQTLKASLEIVDGSLFELSFSRSPRAWSKAKSIEILKCEILPDEVSSLPGDYLQLANDRDAVSIGDWQILPTSDRRLVWHDGEEYRVLAKHGGSFIVSPVGSQDRILIVDHEFHQPAAYTSLTQALKAS